MARFAVAPAASGTASTTAAPVAKMLQAARPMTLQASFAASAPAPAATTSTAGAAPAMAFKPAVLQPRLAATLARTFRPDGDIIERGPVVRDHRVPPVVRDHRVPVTTTQPEAPPAADPRRARHRWPAHPSTPYRRTR